jgi:hypothetical protein
MSELEQALELLREGFALYGTVHDFGDPELHTWAVNAGTFLGDFERREIEAGFADIAARQTGPGSWIPEVMALLMKMGAVKPDPETLAARARAGGAAAVDKVHANPPDGWAWVGEAGPELVRFRGGETVLPDIVARPETASTVTIHVPTLPVTVPAPE